MIWRIIVIPKDKNYVFTSPSKPPLLATIRYVTYLNSERFVLLRHGGHLVLESFELLLPLNAEAEGAHAVLQKSTAKQCY